MNKFFLRTAAVIGTAAFVLAGCGGDDVTTPFSPPPLNNREVFGISIGDSSFDVAFRKIPAGSFRRDEVEANVSVITRDYRMSETEITQELFEAVMGTNPSGFSSNPADGETQEKRPVEKVNWYAAIAFCNKLSIADGKDPVYSVTGIIDEDAWENLAYNSIPTSSDNAWNAAAADFSKNGYRLPTEAEWMWAAMGADTSPGGRLKDFAGSTGSNDIDDYAWYSSISGSKTHEVGKKEANELGLKDMSGNVREWCWDWFGGYPSGESTDYTGPVSGAYRVIRGGG